MPSVSGKQHRFMEMIAHDPGAAKRLGVPQSVGEDFAKADEGRHFSDPHHPKARPRGKWHNQHSGHPKGA